MKKKQDHRPKIDRKMNLEQLVREYPELVEVLSADYGLHCVSCFAAAFDTLEGGAKVHGYNDQEIEKMVKRLNDIIEK